MIEKQIFNINMNRDLVPSDFHPFHLKCMKQARVYCPFMRTLKDEEFEISLYSHNAKIAEENFKKYFIVQWEERERET